jgi:alpha/beta hydrolase fold
MPGLLREGRVTANGLRFAYLEGGSGPLVLLLHGWPDTPHTWDHQLAALAGAGFRVVAPWLRGYPPTEIPRSGFFDIGTLATDVRELIEVLGGGDCELAQSTDFIIASENAIFGQPEAMLGLAAGGGSPAFPFAIASPAGKADADDG